MDRFRSGTAQDRVDRRPRLRNRLAEFGERLGRIAAVWRWPPPAGRRHRRRRNAPIARAEPFSVCASALASAGKAASVPIRLAAWAENIASTSLLEAGIAERHALEMFEIDRTVIGSERRRWHPFNPFEMKRHGDSPDRLAAPIPAAAFSRSQSRNWLTERSVHLPQVRLVFGEKLPQLAGSAREFCEL